ncbi:hypothetical protein [Bradyrhizobium pachyrhizi]
MLLTKWFEDPLRPTRDLDFLATGKDDQEDMGPHLPGDLHGLP